MRIRTLLFTILSMPVLVAGCSYDPSEDPFETFDRRGMLENIASRLISPGFDSLGRTAAELESAAHALALAPTAASLQAAQLAWGRVGLAWKAVEMYRQGPLDNKSMFLMSIDSGTVEAAARTEPIDSISVRAVLESAGTIDRQK